MEIYTPKLKPYQIGAEDTRRTLIRYKINLQSHDQDRTRLKVTSGQSGVVKSDASIKTKLAFKNPPLQTSKPLSEYV